MKLDASSSVLVVVQVKFSDGCVGTTWIRMMRRCWQIHSDARNIFLSSKKEGHPCGCPSCFGAFTISSDQARGIVEVVAEIVGDRLVGDLAVMDVEAFLQVGIVLTRLLPALVGQSHGEGQGRVVEREG